VAVSFIGGGKIKGVSKLQLDYKRCGNLDICKISPLLKKKTFPTEYDQMSSSKFYIFADKAIIVEE
jgi:hypothetical protein